MPPKNRLGALNDPSAASEVSRLLASSPLTSPQKFAIVRNSQLRVVDFDQLKSNDIILAGDLASENQMPEQQPKLAPATHRIILDGVELSPEASRCFIGLALAGVATLTGQENLANVFGALTVERGPGAESNSTIDSMLAPIGQELLAHLRSDLD